MVNHSQKKKKTMPLSETKTIEELRWEYNKLLDSAFALDETASGLERYAKYTEADEVRLLAIKRRDEMKRIDQIILDRCFPKKATPPDESERGRERESDGQQM